MTDRSGRSTPLLALLIGACALNVHAAEDDAGERARQSDFAVAGEVWTSPVLPASGSAGATGAARDNTLVGVYQLALDSDPVLAAAEATWRAGREERRIGLSGLLPQVNASGSVGYTEQESRGAFAIGEQTVSNNTDAEVESDEWALRLEQPLFDVPAWFSFRRGAELTEQARATFTQAQQDLMVRVVSAYFDVLRAAANLSASRAQEEALEAQLDQVKQRFEVGLVAVTDVLDAEAAHDTAVADRVADAAALEVARELLSTITGQQHTRLWRLSEEFPVVNPRPDDADAWVDFALEHNIDLTVAALGRDVALQAARVAASQHLPKVNLALSRSSSNSEIDQSIPNQPDTTPAFDRDQDVSAVTLNLNMPLFSGGRISAQRRQAYARYDSVSRNVELTRRQITQTTRALFINVQRDVARTRARARAIESTQSALEAAQTGYEVGTRNVVDVLNAQRAVFSAIRDHANSIVDFVQDVVALKRQAGILTPADLLELNRWLREPAPPTASELERGYTTDGGAAG